METKQVNPTTSIITINNESELKALVGRFNSSKKVDLATIVILPANTTFDMNVKRYQVLETAKAKAIMCVGNATDLTGKLYKNVSATCDIDELPRIGSTCTIKTSVYSVEKDGKSVDRVKAEVYTVASAYSVNDFAAAAVESKSEVVK